MGYDAQGNLDNKNGKTFDFDHGNRLRRANSWAVSYVYDGLGRRVRDYISGQGSKYTQYSLDGQPTLTSNLRARTVNEYVYLGGSLVAIRQRDMTTNRHTTKYQHTDALGSPVAETNQSRTVLQRSEYEPYGRLLNRPLTDGPGYTGHVSDAATGLAYMQQRYYDPTIGRFLSVDPVATNPSTGAGFNRYKYAVNNPYGFTDPDGRCERATTGTHICGRGSLSSSVKSIGPVGNVNAGSSAIDSGGSVRIGQQAQINNVIEKYGIDTKGANVIFDSGLRGADAWTQSKDLVFVGPSAFRFDTQSYLGATVGHEITHVIQELQGRVSHTRNGMAANEAEAYKVNILNFDRFGNSPAERSEFVRGYHYYYDNLPQEFKDRVNVELGGDY